MFQTNSSSIRLLVTLAVISIVIALGILEVKALGICEFEVAPALALCALPWMTVFFCIRPLPLALLWLAVNFYEEVIHDSLFTYPSLGQFGPVLLLPMDIPYFFTLIFLLLIAIVRPYDMRRVIRDYPFLTLFLVMLMASVVLYTPQYGKEAIGEARKYFFYFFFPVLAFTVIKTVANLHHLLLGVFFLAVGVSGLGYLLLLMGPSIVRLSLRPISANGALILLFAVFSVLIAHANNMTITNRIFDNAMVGLFVPLILLAHHRTVFLAAILGLFLLFELHRRKGLLVLKAIAIAIIAFAVIWVAFMTVPRFEGIFTQALVGLEDPYSDHTGSWRIEGWNQQLAPLSGSELLFGKGLGSYYRWYWSVGGQDQKVAADPHGAYVQLILKFGLFGLFVYVFVALTFFRRMLAARRIIPPGPARAYIEMSLVNFGAAQAFIAGYAFNLIILVFCAIGIATVRLLEDDLKTRTFRVWPALQGIHAYSGRTGGRSHFSSAPTDYFGRRRRRELFGRSWASSESRQPWAPVWKIPL